MSDYMYINTHTYTVHTWNSTVFCSWQLELVTGVGNVALRCITALSEDKWDA